MTEEDKKLRNLIAHRNAVSKYNKANYKTFSVNLKNNEYETLECLLSKTNQSKSRLVKATLKYADENPEFIEFLKSVKV